ncbi:MAG TPA: ABC transporter permease, partial [Thauera aminoaromatica]|nr:ABC transporter permease [Thauera aminoaromatica]
MSAAPRHEARAGEALLAGDGVAAVLRLRGDWTLAHHAALRRQADALRGRIDAATRVELGELGTLDTAGARLLHG